MVLLLICFGMGWSGAGGDMFMQLRNPSCSQIHIHIISLHPNKLESLLSYLLPPPPFLCLHHELSI